MPDLQAPAQMRCAIYTRKSTTNALDINVNSLQTQREVCQAYIRCQEHRSWLELPRQYDDGGFSGGNLERPALKRLLDDIEAGGIDIVVVYKIDRLSRSLADFVRLLDLLDKYAVGFVSVTQTFDTSDSMGRLILNILLTFAQFERELASDRIRDKHADLRRRGCFTGGVAPFGFKLAKGGRLVEDEERVAIVRELYERFPSVTARQLARELNARGVRTRQTITKKGKMRGGWAIDAVQITRMLSNPIYAGYVTFKGQWIKAQIQPLVSRQQWDLVQEVKLSRSKSIDPTRDYLLDILHDKHGRRMGTAMIPSRKRKTRYYRSASTAWSRDGRTTPVMYVDADRIEKLTISALQAFLLDRIRLKEAILSLGSYSHSIASSLGKGALAARRLAAMGNSRIRPLLLALVPRAEFDSSMLRLYVCSYELSRFLNWDGIGVFGRSKLQPPRIAEHVWVVKAPSPLLCGEPRFTLPITPCPDATAAPKPWLVEVLKRATHLRELTMANRDKSISQLAHAKKIGPGTFARYLRANYLAPDIQAAIMDGTQPDDLTEWDLLKGPMPLDWEQQRQLLGFHSLGSRV